MSEKNKFVISFPSETELVMEREFNAPRELVFKAHLDAEIIPKWWGPRQYATRVEALDARPGGKWRFIQTGEDGTEIAFFGEYRLISPHDKFVNTFGFDGMPGEPGEEEYNFIDLGNGRTLLRTYSKFKSKEELEAVLASGMEWGANETYDRLEEYLAT
ncbi:MAG TPA: SRPBCC family protein [Anaerolineales bacterium]|nr:SRPBCC family protein [Anaerolineales bacterium]HRQ92630.1 SRPBCC family protein [Anaerolineales bacterium]